MPTVIFPGPEGRLEGRFSPAPRPRAPVAMILHPHPQGGGTMNERNTQALYKTFVDRGFATLRFNFRGVGRSQGSFDNGVGELSDAASALDWVQQVHPEAQVTWVAGVSFGAPEKKLGWNASPTAQVIFEDARVPVENRVGDEGEGFRFAMMGLDGGRLNIGACSLGGAQRCLDEAVKYTKERQQFGQAIADFQNTQFMLADMATELEAARALLYLAAAKVTDNAPDKSRFSAMAKRLATDSGSNVVNNALQLFGGYGYLKEYPIERFWRDLRVHSILEGTNQVMRMIVGRDMLRQ